MASWGWCGVVAVEGGQVIGHLVLEPVVAADDATGEDGDGPGRWRADGDTTQGTARLVRMVRLHPVSTVDGEASTSAALARQLIETAAARLLRRRVLALRATAHRWAGDCGRPPTALLAGRGFVVVHQHPVHPTMQLELDRTVPGDPVLGQVWRRLTELVRSPPPEPIGFSGRTRPRSGALGG